MKRSCVAFHAPLLDRDLRLLQGIEDFSVQALIAQLAVEAFTVAVFPCTPRFNVQPSNAQPGQLIRREAHTTRSLPMYVTLLSPHEELMQAFPAGAYIPNCKAHA